MDELGFRMHAERTPNPNSIKWVLGTPVTEPGVSANFMEPVDAEVSPLAARLFGVRGIRGVFFAANFITVSKEDDVDWQDIAQDLVDAIKAHVDSGDPATVHKAGISVRDKVVSGQHTSNTDLDIDIEI